MFRRLSNVNGKFFPNSVDRKILQFMLRRRRRKFQIANSCRF